MLSLSHATGCAIQALTCVEGPSGTPIMVRDIAKATGITKPYLAKIIHALALRGLVVTKRGRSGGVLLAREARKISLIEVAEAVGGVNVLSRCLLGMNECTDTRACPAHAMWKPIREKILKGLSRLTLDRAAEFEREFRARGVRKTSKTKKSVRAR